MWSSRYSFIFWHSMCVPKNEGGAGLRDLRVWNNALLARVLWDIHLKKDSLWAKWIHDTYLSRVDLWRESLSEVTLL